MNDQSNVPLLTELRQEAADALQAAIVLTVDEADSAHLAAVQAVAAIAKYASGCLIDQQRLDAEQSIAVLKGES